MKTGLVLGGGGAKGSYQIGVWKGLRELGIKIDCVAGSSVGSLNGVLVAQDSYEKALKIWNTNTSAGIFSIDTPTEYAEFTPVKAVAGLPIEEVFGYANEVAKGGAQPTGLQEIMTNNLDEDVLRNSGIDFGLCITNTKTGSSKYVHLKDIPKGEVSKYILASSACFPVAHTVDIDNVTYADGGFTDNLPVTIVSDMGAERIICVDLKAVGYIPPHRVELVKDISKEFIYIEPKWDLGNMLYFNSEIAEKNIQLGYLDCMKAFGKYAGSSFTFERDSFVKDGTGDLKNLIIRAADHLGVVFELDPYVLYDKKSFDIALRAKAEDYLNVQRHETLSLNTILENSGKLSIKDRIARIAIDFKAKEEESKYLSPTLYKLIEDDILAATYLYYYLI